MIQFDFRTGIVIAQGCKNSGELPLAGGEVGARLRATASGSETIFDPQRRVGVILCRGVHHRAYTAVCMAPWRCTCIQTVYETHANTVHSGTAVPANNAVIIVSVARTSELSHKGLR